MPSPRSLTSYETLQILKSRAAGEPTSHIAQRFGISFERVENLAKRYSSQPTKIPVPKPQRFYPTRPGQLHWQLWARGMLDQPPARWSILPNFILCDPREPVT